MEKHKEVGNDTVPLGVSRLLTFCKREASTKPEGGQLIPTVVSLLSTSNMMTSNNLPPRKEKKNSQSLVQLMFYYYVLSLDVTSLSRPFTLTTNLPSPGQRYVQAHPQE